MFWGISGKRCIKGILRPEIKLQNGHLPKELPKDAILKLILQRLNFRNQYYIIIKSSLSLKKGRVDLYSSNCDLEISIVATSS